MLAPDRYGLLPIQDVDPAALVDFDCGKRHLNEFLQTIALPFHEQRLGLTNVVFHSDHPGPIGYFTLSNDAIRLSEAERFDMGVEQDVQITYFPAVKLCRLAITTTLQGQGSGVAIMDLIRGEVYDSVSNSAARLLVVDADNEPRVIKFYEKNGFFTSLVAEGVAKSHKTNKTAPTVKMWLDVLALA